MGADRVLYSRLSDLQNSASRLPTQFENLAKCPPRSRYSHSANSTCNSVLTRITSKHHAYFSLYYAGSLPHLPHLRGADNNKMAASTRRLHQGFKTLHSTGARARVFVSLSVCVCVCVCDTVCMWVFECVTALVFLILCSLTQLFNYRLRQK